MGNSALKIFSILLLRLHALALRKSLLALALTALLTLLLIGGLPRLKLLLNIDDLIDQDFVTAPYLNILNREFEAKNGLFVVATTKNHQPFENAEICVISKWIEQRLSNAPGAVRVVSTFGIRKPEFEEDRVNFRPLLSTKCVDSQSLSPKNESTVSTFEALAASPWHGILTSANGHQDLAAQIDFESLEEPSSQGSFDPAPVKNLIESFAREVTGTQPNIIAHWSGPAVYQHYMKVGLDFSQVLNLVTVLLILLGCRLLFGNFKSGLIFLITLLWTAIVVHGGMGYTDVPIDMLTNSLFLMLVVSSLEDFILLSHLQRLSTENKNSWRSSYRRILISSFFTSFTTVIGFGSLIGSDLGIIRRFGLWAAVAAGTEWIAVFLVLPALAKQFEFFRVWVSPKKIRAADWLETISRFHLPRLLATGLMSVYFVAFFGASSLKVSDTPPAVFPQGHPFRTAVSYFFSTRNWQADVSLLFDSWRDRKNNEAAIALITKHPLVARWEDPYRTEKFLKENLSDQQTLVVDSFWLRSPTRDRLIGVSSSARAILYLRDSEITTLNGFRRDVEELCRPYGCHLAGSLVSYGEFGERVLATLMDSLFTSLVLVALILFWLAHSLKYKNKMVLITTALWGPCAVLCIFVIFRLPIYFITSIFASVLVGLAGDNTIQFMFGSRRGQIDNGLQERSGAAVALTLFMMILSLVFGLSYFAPIRTLGILFAGGFFLGLIGDIWLLRSLQKISDRP